MKTFREIDPAQDDAKVITDDDTDVLLPEGWPGDIEAAVVVLKELWLIISPGIY